MGIYFSKKPPKINKIPITTIKEILLCLENNHNFRQKKSQIKTNLIRKNTKI